MHLETRWSQSFTCFGESALLLCNLTDALRFYAAHRNSSMRTFIERAPGKRHKVPQWWRKTIRPCRRPDMKGLHAWRDALCGLLFSANKFNCRLLYYSKGVAIDAGNCRLYFCGTLKCALSKSHFTTAGTAGQRIRHNVKVTWWKPALILWDGRTKMPEGRNKNSTDSFFFFFQTPSDILI